jgi:hypothetical protein
LGGGVVGGGGGGAGVVLVAGEGGKRAAKLKFPGFTNFYRGKNSGSSTLTRRSSPPGLLYHIAL